MLTHRGPDDMGNFVDDSVGLANTRLSIVDLKDGHQPMSNEDSQIWVTFNGEIFNCGALRRNLEERGHEFATRSDTEVLVHLYEEVGDDFVCRLNGMFAFALWDAERQALLLARDYAGMKPLYYLNSEGCFYFASEMKALLRLQPSVRVDPISLGDFLVLGYTPSERTLFAGIRKLRPGRFMIVDADGFRLKTYHMFVPKVQALGPAAADERMFGELSRATSDWLMADVPVGAYLSGGVDSSIIATLAARGMERELQTYTAWFGEEYPNELAEARIVAEYIGADHTPVLVDEKTVLQSLKRIAWFYEEPIAEAAVIPTYFVSKQASKTVKVVLAGEGADELFGGYPWHKAFAFLDPFHQGLEGVTGTRQQGLSRRLVLPPKLSTLISPNYSMTQRYLIFQSVLQPSEVDRLLPGASHDLLVETFAEFLLAPNTTKLSRVLLCDTMTLLAENFLMKADKGSMANSVEERTPYLDKSLMTFAFSLTDRQRIGLLREKILLRRAARRLLPSFTARRRKRGYGTPVGGWIRGEIGDYLLGLAEESQLLNTVLRREEVKRILRLRRRRPGAFWLLGTLALWEQTFLEAGGVPSQRPNLEP